jgi:hypothetical protein
MGGFWVETGRSIEGRNSDGRMVFDPEQFSSPIFCNRTVGIVPNL